MAVSSIVGEEQKESLVESGGLEMGGVGRDLKMHSQSHRQHQSGLPEIVLQVDFEDGCPLSIVSLKKGTETR